ncbi:plasmid replication protein RepC [uncultured Sphingomonas sp.]|uniref:plasmid replication protein RepC n=1 Tax=uncultured Sphingomonas sp. TaxID=158754 RepID=UPI0035CA7F46
MTYALRPGAGFRRFDVAAAQAGEIANAFCGLPTGASPGQALAAFKKAASYLDVPARVVQLMDTLFAWTKPEDWRSAETPIVWPRNDKLAQKLGLKVRQVQNLLNTAVALGLISHRDSPSGHRGGVRAADGSIKWAYGIVLSPIGTRMAEFVGVAKRGAEEDELLDGLKRRLTAARRRTAALAQAALDHDVPGSGADEELELAQMAARRMRGIRDVAVLTSCVADLEIRSRALEARIAEALDVAGHDGTGNNTIETASTHGDDCMRSTTTNQLKTAKAVTSSSLSIKSSLTQRDSVALASTPVEDDLEKHGIDPDFIESVASGLFGAREEGRKSWGEIIHLAEELVFRHRIHRHVWSEASRLMGPRGAAAAVIATLQKYQAGDVDRPGAYLRGMSERASKGELNLGRTFHGLKDVGHSVAMTAIREGGDSLPFGALARSAIQRQLVLSGKVSGSGAENRARA